MTVLVCIAAGGWLFALIMALQVFRLGHVNYWQARQIEHLVAIQIEAADAAYQRAAACMSPSTSPSAASSPMPPHIPLPTGSGSNHSIS